MAQRNIETQCVLCFFGNFNQDPRYVRCYCSGSALGLCLVAGKGKTMCLISTLKGFVRLLIRCT